MMRPGSATTFSNFDHLDTRCRRSPDFRRRRWCATDRKGVRFPLDIIAGHLDIFADGRAKELLITPNGVRIVWLLAEADRARYGVFRQAEFGDASARSGADRAIAARGSPSLRAAINRGAKASGMTDPRLHRAAESLLVLGAAIVLPASGHVLLGVAARGLQFLFFMVMLGWVTTKIAPADASFIGRHAGGFLIYALSVLDAYRIARIRHAQWAFRTPGAGDGGNARRHT